MDWTEAECRVWVQREREGGVIHWDYVQLGEYQPIQG